MQNVPYIENVGGVIRGLLNGLKHTPETISPIISVDQQLLERIITGKEPLNEFVENALISITGINQRDFYPYEFRDLFPVVGDTDLGVRIMRSGATQLSQRMLTRGPEKMPYYIYADTAMSNTSTFRPEWIKELFVHDGESADDLPDWAFNKGHNEHQCTYFIGPVNFYWIDKAGNRHVAKMNTGDTNYIVPFVPHTFSTREEGKGLILAVTYGGVITIPEVLMSIRASSPDAFIAELHKRQKVVPTLIDRRVVGGVVIQRYGEAKEDADDKNVVPLVHSQYQPDTMVKEVTLYGNKFTGFTAQDRWVYNIGDSFIDFVWYGKTEILNPGDSMFIAPHTGHVFKGDGKILIIDIRPGSGDPFQELGLIDHYVGESGLRRVHTESTQWY